MDTPLITGSLNRPNKLKEIAASQGEAVEQLIPRIVREEGSIAGAARRLGVGNTTIRYWLKKLGLKVESRRVSVLELAEAHKP